MSSSNLTTLPPELHLKIRSYLIEVDSIILSLTSKKLYAAYASRPQFRFPTNCFWAMIWTDPADDIELKQQMLAQWDMRLKVLPRLRHWIERVTGDAGTRAVQDMDVDKIDHHVTWEICAGCACYKKVDTNDWQEGWEFEDVMDENPAFEDWTASQWDILQRHIWEGRFCRSCFRVWEKLRVPWDVGICAS